MTSSIEPGRRAVVAGLGVIGGSIASGLRRAGWHVSGHDTDGNVLQEALRRQVVDSIEIEGRYDMAIVAAPVPEIVTCVQELLQISDVVTDAGSVKAGIVDAVSDERFIGGHPMAGSERSGLDGVDAGLFQGATWVLTPSLTTAASTYETVRNTVEQLGAAVVTLDAVEHDEIVASVSHVPHLAASALMNVALERAEKHSSLMRLAAGGFRDMTRIAAGHPGLWRGITLENRVAVVDELSRVIAGLEQFRDLIENQEGERLEKLLAVAAEARRDLPARVGRPADLSVLRVTVADKPGGLATVFGVLRDQGVNIEDFEITHDPNAPQGSLHISVAESSAEAAAAALRSADLSVAVEVL